jgi:propionyl-CoA synthetase
VFKFTPASQVVASHPEVAECCVVGAADALKGQLPLGLIVLSQSATSPPQDIEAQVGAL